MLSVLVVDTDRSFLDLFQKTAGTWPDVEVATACCAKEAGDYLGDHPCDVVISEYILPDRDGIDLLRSIRSRHGDLPFMLVTGNGSEAVAAEASRFGISAYIIKGPDTVSLFSEIYGKLRVENGRKEALRALQEKESHCRAILESQPGFICRLRPDLTMTYMNPAFRKAMGIAGETRDIPPFPGCLTGEDRDHFLSAFRELSLARPSFTIRLRLVPLHSGGTSPLWTEWTFTAGFDTPGTPAVIQGAGRDITWKLENERLRKRRIGNFAFLSRTAMDFVNREDSASITDYIAKVVYDLLPHSIVGVLTYDPELDATRLESVIADEDILAAFRQHFHTEMRDMVFPLGHETFARVDYLSKGITEGPPLYYFLLHQFPEDACRKVVEQCNLGRTYAAGFTSQGKLYGSVCFMLRKGATIENPDLLEAFLNQASVAFMRWRTRTMADREIERLNADLEQKVRDRTRNLEIANRNLESFAYSVSHDLRAPLRSIDGFSTILLSEFGETLPPRGKQLVDKIRQSTEKMEELIEAILVFSRSTHKDLVRVDVDMAALARGVTDEQAAACPGFPVEVTIAPLPPCHADPVLLWQVWENLVSNAIKFSRKRGVARITIGASRRGDECVYFIRDEGTGFDLARSSRIFGVFERFCDGKEYEGTGIGLAIVWNIIHRHGGTVWMESAVDQGCTCFFTIGGEE